MGNERGNYFDQWERGEYSIDPRDLVRHNSPGISTGVVIYDRQAFNQLMGIEGGLVKAKNANAGVRGNAVEVILLQQVA